MQTLAVSLPDELVETVREQARAAGCHDENTYLAKLVSDAVLNKLREQLDAKLLEGIRDLDEGRGEQVTPEYWRRLRAKFNLPPAEAS